MKIPPSYIDKAKVLEWAWSDNMPFGVVNSDNGELAIEIYGLAICRYESSGKVYRFSCDRNWEAEQDSNYGSISEAKERLPEQYKQVEIVWHTYEL